MVISQLLNSVDLIIEANEAMVVILSIKELHNKLDIEPDHRVKKSEPVPCLPSMYNFDGLVYLHT